MARLKKTTIVTERTLHAATGLDCLKKQKEYFEKVICKVEEEKSTNAIATLVTKVLPVLYPCLEYREKGCIPLYRKYKLTIDRFSRWKFKRKF